MHINYYENEVRLQVVHTRLCEKSVESYEQNTYLMALVEQNIAEITNVILEFVNKLINK